MVNYAGFLVPGILASDIEHLVLRFEKPPNEEEPLIIVKPDEFTFTAQLPLPDAMQVTPDQRELVRMKAIQLPILVNNATTGHKLQGATIDSIFIHCWSKTKNWPYVVLSRVTTLKGLFLRQPHPSDMSTYEQPHGLRNLLFKMDKIRPNYMSSKQYQEILTINITTVL